MTLNKYKTELKFTFIDFFNEEVYKRLQTHLNVILANIECCISGVKLSDEVVESLVNSTIDLILSMRQYLDTTYLFITIGNILEIVTLTENSLIPGEHYESCFNLIRFKQLMYKITDQNYDYEFNSFL